MKNYALINGNNIVTNVAVTNDDWVWDSGNWIEYTNLNDAGIGFTYDATKNAFIAPKPFNSWVLNKATYLWEAPVAMPTDDKFYYWDEATTSWVEAPAVEEAPVE